MNHCRKCDSDYATPGTCNCFASKGGGTEGADYWRGYAAGQAAPRGWYSPWYQTPYTVTYTKPLVDPSVTITHTPTDGTTWTVPANDLPPNTFHTTGFMQVLGPTS